MEENKLIKYEDGLNSQNQRNTKMPSQEKIVKTPKKKSKKPLTPQEEGLLVAFAWKMIKARQTESESKKETKEEETS